MAPSQKTPVIDIIGSFNAGTVRAILRHHADLSSQSDGARADMRTHLLHHPERDIIPPLGGTRVFSYRI